MVLDSPAAAEETPAFQPGKEARVDLPGIGQDHFMLFLPKNYEEDKDWPVIVFFHGKDQKPNTRLPRGITKGSDFIVIGMGYPSGSSGAGTQVENIKKALVYTHKHTSIDEQAIMLMGWSKGGWAGSGYAEASGELWRGVVLMGSGRTGSRPGALRGKPVFIGVGENDANRSSAESAAELYRKNGANVTLELWEGMGHAVNTKSETMRDWLIDTGVLYELPALIKSAQRDERSRRLGKAYNQYLAASQKRPDHEDCKAAGKKADELAAQAQALIDKARTAMNDQDWNTAKRSISDLSRQFSGSTFADEADTLRKELTQKRREAK
eukprot:g12126.t1